MQPMYDRIIVTKIHEDSVTKGGIFIPDQAKEKPTRGKVVAVGPGQPKEDGTLRPLYLKPGDEVLFGRYAGSELTINNQPILILKEEDVLVKLDTQTSATE